MLPPLDNLTDNALYLGSGWWGNTLSIIEIYFNLWEKAVKNSGRVHTTMEKFENTAIFPRLGLPSPLVRHENALQTGGIWKHGYLSMVRPTVSAGPSWKLFKQEEFENTAIFLCHENALETGGIWKHGYLSMVRPTVSANPSRKRSSNWRNLKTLACVLVWTRNILG